MRMFRKMIPATLAAAVLMLALLFTVRGAMAGSDADYLFDGEGTYYLTGVQLGVNLTFHEGTLRLSLSDGRISEESGCTMFRFESCGGNRYIIRPECERRMYLTYGYMDQLTAEAESGPIPEKGIWRVMPQQGGVKIVNAANGHVLVTYGLEPVLKTQAEVAADPSTSLWLTVKTTCYGTDANAPVRELRVEEKSVEKAITKSSVTAYCDLFGFSWGPFSRPEDFTFSVDAPEVMTIGLDGAIRVQSTGEATITARHRYTGQKLSAQLRVSNNAIVIVPGFMGSELKNKKGEKIWSESLLDELSNNLSISTISRFLDLSSPSSGDGITAVDNIFGALDLYKDLYRVLSRTYGKDYSIEMYSYDWRRSSETTGQALARYLDGKGYDNVIFVTHSFGGLVCGQALIASESLRNSTSLVCLIGVPVNGTVGIAQAWAQDRFGNVLGLGSFGSMENSAIRRIICTLPSVYEMLPSAYAVEQLGVIGGCSSHSAFRSACAESCGSFDKSLAADAARVNAKLRIDGTSVFDLVPTVVFGGTGYDTAEKASVSGSELRFGNTTDGDGIVTRSDCLTGIGEVGQQATGVPSRHLWLCQEQGVLDGVTAAIDATKEE